MNVLEIKAAIRERDCHRCTECGMTSGDHLLRYGKDLEVHRVTPGSPYAVDETCVTLCRRCHGPKPKRKRGSLPWRKFRLPEDLYIKAKFIAKTQGVSVAQYIDRAIRESLDREWPRVAAIIAERAAKPYSKPPREDE